MKILFRMVNGRIFRACRENNPGLAGFGNTEEEATAQLEEREKSPALEIEALLVLLHSLLGPNQNKWMIN